MTEFFCPESLWHQPEILQPIMSDLANDTGTALFHLVAIFFHICQCPQLLSAAAVSGNQGLGGAAVLELLWDWLEAFTAESEWVRIVVWHLGFSL